MNFVKHLNLEGLHAPFSASQSAWLRYSDDKAIAVYRKRKQQRWEPDFMHGLKTQLI